MENFNIFEMMYESFKFKNDKPIRLIEFFAGYGSQALGLKYLKINFEHYKICEWAIPSIIAYANLHQNELEYYGQNFCGDLTKEQIADLLFQYGVSDDYNSPCTLEKLKKMPEEKLRLVFNSIQWTNNLVDISRVKGYELGIEREREYILTYSFPCQDLSLAGKGKGMKEGSGTRSSLLFEVERILSECEYKPQVLIMENVPQVHGTNNITFFKNFILRLEKLGYESYWNDMSATDYAIPQTRNRTFMVSILNGKNGEKYNYTFPKKIPLKLRLKDLLESNVDEKYYLSEKMINGMLKTNFESYKFENKLLDRKGNASTIIARFEGAPQLVAEEIVGTYDYAQSETFRSEEERLHIGKEVSGSIISSGNQNAILIKNATKKGYLEATDGDGIDISSRMESHRGTVQKGKAQTLTTMGGEDVGVAVKEIIPNYTEKSIEKIKSNIINGDVSSSLTVTGMQSINHDGCQLVKEENKVVKVGNYMPSNHNASSIVSAGGGSPNCNGKSWNSNGSERGFP